MYTLTTTHATATVAGLAQALIEAHRLQFVAQLAGLSIGITISQTHN